jgi:hypothetical protein
MPRRMHGTGRVRYGFCQRLRVCGGVRRPLSPASPGGVPRMIRKRIVRRAVAPGPSRP